MPGEIEERLLSHNSIVEASVIGAPHPKYGESVAAFVRQAEQTRRPSDEHVVADFPKTASGKHQKHLLRDLAAKLLKCSVIRAKL
jgi:acyl-coenzyme A synthetase/AMP-(fatty) acid ligase